MSSLDFKNNVENLAMCMIDDPMNFRVGCIESDYTIQVFMEAVKRASGGTCRGICQRIDPRTFTFEEWEDDKIPDDYDRCSFKLGIINNQTGIAIEDVITVIGSSGCNWSIKGDPDIVASIVNATGEVTVQALAYVMGHPVVKEKTRRILGKQATIELKEE